MCSCEMVISSHNLTAIFRAPPEDPASYAPFVYPITAGRMSEHTIPVMTAVLEEMLTVGGCHIISQSMFKGPEIEIETARALDFSDPPFDKPDSIVDSILNKTRELHEKADNIHTPSMLLDVQNGRPFEVEVIVGEVVRMAQARKIEIPVSVIFLSKMTKSNFMYSESSSCILCYWSFKTSC